MGITLDKAIDILEHYKEYGFVSQANGRNKAISIMRKYQKIEQIYSDYLDDMDAEKLADKLGEVF